MASAPFVPTHTVPATGLRAWSEPDGTGPPAARLDPHLDVQVVERKGDWAHIACFNGWQAWVDGRRLVPWRQAPTQVQPQAPTQASPWAQASAPAPARASVKEIRGLSIASLVGGIAIAGGSFLDWWSLGPIGVNAWDIPLEYLLAGKPGEGLDTGPILLALAAVLAVTLVIGRRLPSIVLLLVAAGAMGLAGAALIRGLRNDPSTNPDIGLFATLAGGALVAADGFGLFTGRAG